jgi:hypothetical protein
LTIILGCGNLKIKEKLRRFKSKKKVRIKAMKFQTEVTYDNGTSEIFPPVVAGFYQKAIQKTVEILENRFNAKVFLNSYISNQARIIDYNGCILYQITIEWWKIKTQK